MVKFTLMEPKRGMDGIGSCLAEPPKKDFEHHPSKRESEKRTAESYPILRWLPIGPNELVISSAARQ
jgi:hypothetical protein